MEENNNNNNNNNINNNEILGVVPARRVRDFDLNKEPTPSPQVSGKDDCHVTMGEVEEVQSDQVLPAVVQTAAMVGVEEVQSDQVPAVVQTEPSKDKGKRPMVFSEEDQAHDKVDGGGGSGVIQENINAVAAADDDDISHQPERKRHRSDSIKVRAPRLKVLLRTENEFLDDGYRWRKYGQKNIKGNNNVPRAYYRCCDKNCLVRKQVERDGEDQRITVITYEGRHNHEKPPTTMHANAAVARAHNAILRGTINRNNNNIPPMQLHPLHFRYHVFEYGSSSNGSSAYPTPVVPFPAAIPPPPPPPPPTPLPTSPAAAAATPPAAAAAGVNLNLSLSLNLNECGTSSAPAEECSNKVPKNDNDDQQNDI